eukprot:8072176-Alexandrium_andersonii.AAC.1
MDDHEPKVTVAAIRETLLAETIQELLDTANTLHNAPAVRANMHGKIRKHGIDEGKQFKAGRAGGRME